MTMKWLIAVKIVECPRDAWQGLPAQFRRR